MRRKISIPTLAIAITLIATPALVGWVADWVESQWGAIQLNT